MIKSRWETICFLFLFSASAVKRRVAGIEILTVQFVCHDSHGFTNLTKSKRCPKTLDT